MNNSKGLWSFDFVCHNLYAHRLKELGMHQDTYWYYIQGQPMKDHENKIIDHNYSIMQKNVKEETEKTTEMIAFSAYNTDELMEMIPARIVLDNHEFHKEPFNSFNYKLQKCSTWNIQYVANYECDTYACVDRWMGNMPMFRHNVFDSKLANCLAKMVIKLIEDKIITI